MRLAPLELVEIAAQGVDFAVVGEIAERVREAPGRERIRGIALVHERKGTFHCRIAQVRIKAVDLRCQKQALVHNGLRRAARQIRLGNRLFNLAAREEELALKGGLIGRFAGTDKQLANPRQALPGRFADGFRMHRHIAPRERGKPFRSEAGFDRRFLSVRTENHGHGIAARRRQRNLLLLESRAEKPVRNGKEEPGTVARQRIAAGCAAVHQALENPDALLNDVMRGTVIQPCNHADTAGVVLILETVQPEIRGTRLRIAARLKNRGLLPDRFFFHDGGEAIHRL